MVGINRRPRFAALKHLFAVKGMLHCQNKSLRTIFDVYVNSRKNKNTRDEANYL